MNALSQWILAVCIAAVTGGLLRMLLPPGSMERTMRWVICVFTLSCLLLPLLQSSGWEWDFSSLETTGEPNIALAEQVEEQTRYLIERELLSKVQDVVEAEGAKLTKFHLNTDSEGGSGIDITQVEVVLRASDAERCNRVHARLEEELGLTALVSAADEGLG